MVELARTHFAYKEYWLKPQATSPQRSLYQRLTHERLYRKPEYFLAAEVIQHNPITFFKLYDQRISVWLNSCGRENWCHQFGYCPRWKCQIFIPDIEWSIFLLNAEQSNFKHFLKFYPNCHERRRQIPDLDRFIAVRATRCLAGSRQKHSSPSKKPLTSGLLSWNSSQTTTKVVTLKCWEVVREHHTMHSLWLQTPKKIRCACRYFRKKIIFSWRPTLFCSISLSRCRRSAIAGRGRSWLPRRT